MTTEKSGYPKVLQKQLPEAKVAFPGARGWLLQAPNSQLLFFEFEKDTNLPEHNHTYAQWGVVLDGEMELHLDSKPRHCKTGDEYVIPPGVMHGAKFFRRTRVMDFFPEKDRYKPK